MTAKAMRRRARAKTVKFQSGPWKGIWDTPVVSRATSELAGNAVNAYLKDGAWWARPSHTRTTTQYGSASRTGHAMCPVEVGGVWYNFAVIGDKLYRATDATQAGAWTDVTPAGPDFTKVTDLVAFNGTLIASLSGNNRPLVLSALTAGTVTSTAIDLDSAGSTWNVYGPATVYAGRVFFILQNVVAGAYAGFYQDTIVWSEPNTPLVGYRQTSFADFWQLSQSGQELLSGIRGTETALYYWRYNSIGAIYGKVDTQFVGEATQDSVSLTVGAANGRAIVQVGTDYLWFVDQIGRVWRLRIGDEPEPVWKAMAQRLVQLQVERGANLVPHLAIGAIATYDVRLGVVRINLVHATGTSSGVASRSQEVFDATTGTFLGYWTMGSDSAYTLQARQFGCWIDMAGVLRDANGTPVYVMIGSLGQSATTYAIGNLGYIWYENLPNIQAGDVDGATNRPYNFGVVTHLMLDADDEELQLERSTLSFGSHGAEVVNLQYCYQSPYATAALTSVSVAASALSQDDAVGTEVAHGRAMIGYGSNAQGRWFRHAWLRNQDTTPTGYTFLERFSFEGTVVPVQQGIR